jgi:hypothetical protein
MMAEWSSARENHGLSSASTAHCSSEPGDPAPLEATECSHRNWLMPSDIQRFLSSTSEFEPDGPADAQLVPMQNPRFSTQKQEDNFHVHSPETPWAWPDTRSL